jgi:transcriptional regulator with XRE-family HTH domain
MEIEQIIGDHIREARTKLGWTQVQLGVHMLALLGEAWSPQAVSQAEKGARDFRAADLFALAVALDQPVEWFLSIPEGEKVDLPGSVVELTEENRYVIEPKTAGQTMALFRGWFGERSEGERED